MRTDERRSEPRYRVSIRVHYQGDGRNRTSKVFNLGRQGLFICSDQPVPAGTLLHLTVDLSGSEKPIEAEGQVVWTNRVKTADLPAGMGVRFTEIDKENQRRLSEQLQNLP